MCAPDGIRTWSWNPLDLEAEALPIEPPHPPGSVPSRYLVLHLHLHDRPGSIEEPSASTCRTEYSAALAVGVALPRLGGSNFPKGIIKCIFLKEEENPPCECWEESQWQF